MFLTKNKILQDKKFLRDITTETVKGNRELLLDLLIAMHPDSPDDQLNKKVEDEFFDKIFEGLTNRLFNDNNLAKLIQRSLDKLLSDDDGKELIYSIVEKTEASIIESKKKSKEPWVNIKGEVWDEEKGRLAIDLDWNDAFIALLRKQGIVAEDESQAVEQWLTGLANQ